MPIRTIFKIFLGLTILQYAAFAKEPEIQIKDGRVSIAAEGVPLGRLLSLLDRATGMNSQVKPELASRPINVQFTDLEFEDAVRKIFQGQPLNYVVIAGKAIQVTEASTPVTAAAGSVVPATQQNPFAQQPPPQPAAAAPAAGNQPAVTVFGARPDPSAATPNPTYTAPSNMPAALSNNPALNLEPPRVGQQPGAPQQPQGGAPTPAVPGAPTPGIPR